MIKKTVLVSASFAAALVAQPAQIVEDKPIHILSAPAVAAPVAGSFTFVNAEMGFEATIVKGVPFTGDFVTENSQTLADGNRIRNSNTTSYARDGEGRTRREVTIGAMGPFAEGSAHKTIFIHDPVAKIDYILDPQNKTARKIVLGTLPAKLVAEKAARESRAMTFTRRVEGPRESVDVMVEHSAALGPVMIERAPAPAGMVVHGEAGVVAGRSATISAFAGGKNANFKSDSLGKRMIEGVEAEGTRTTVTIPAGQIGNDLPIDTVSERWYSDELKTVVLTTRKDPMAGENTYRLTNLRRGEPSRILFEMPSDYMLVTEDVVGPNTMRLKLDKERERKQE